MDKWIPVTKINQLNEGIMIKIVGFSEKDSYKWIRVKKVLKMKAQNPKREWIEILINKKKNYYFNLSVYLENKPEPTTWGHWVKELYFRNTFTL